jgi:hypothetical protein
MTNINSGARTSSTADVDDQLADAVERDVVPVRLDRADGEHDHLLRHRLVYLGSR